jgi:protein involved in polysaccharide export with SLBB domain
MKTKISLKTLGLFAATACLLCGAGAPLPAAADDPGTPRFVYVAGEVKVPQKYVYSRDLTLAKAIKLAKGVTSKASDKVTLSREGSDDQTFKLKAIQKDGAPDIKLKPGDKVFVSPKE